MNDIKTLIEEFIRKEIPVGHIFDAHSIIDFLIESHSDVYLDFHTPQETTALFHSRISKIIDSFGNSEQPIIQRLSCDSYSRNIHNNYTPNACWRKL